MFPDLIVCLTLGLRESLTPWGWMWGGVRDPEPRTLSRVMFRENSPVTMLLTPHVESTRTQPFADKMQDYLKLTRL